MRIANDNVYGLSGMVFSGSEALAVAGKIRAGTVGVNGGVFWRRRPVRWLQGQLRQGGLEGFNQYLETKTISVPSARLEQIKARHRPASGDRGRRGRRPPP